MILENKYRIVKIIDDYHIVINAGSKDGITQDDNFKIINKQGEPINDPETGDFLGYLNTVKDYVKAKDVHEKMTVCESLRTVEYDFSTILNPLKRVEKKRLNVDLSQITGGEEPTNETIRIGDEVVKIN